MLSGTELRATLEDTLNRSGIDYDAVIAEFGQVPACDERAAGKKFTLHEHVRGLIFALLSNQRPWGPIAENLPAISAVFLDYDPIQLKSADPDQLVHGLRALRCGNRAVNKQMAGLSSNIEIFERIASEHGSMDAFIIHDQPYVVARLFSKPGKYKLMQIGFTLALEYLRNVGVPAIKPDVHIRRALSGERLRFSSHLPSELEAYDILMDLSRSAGCNPTYLDNLLWIFCAQNYAGICSAQPRCNRCGFAAGCNYPR